MRVLQNPIVLKSIFVFCIIAGLFMIAVIFIRLLKKGVMKQDETPRPDPERAGFSLAAYEGVITRMKEQERELERLRRSEAERARESATVSEAIISNLASGVVLFNTAGLIRQANPAARVLLGYASPSSMHARGIFRTVTAVRFTEDFASDVSTPADRLVSAIESSISDGYQFRRVEADYTTPAGNKRVLGITISPVRLPAGDRLGAACLLTDLTDISRLSEQIKLQENMAALGEMSAGIAHEFKNSLATISGYAQMLTQESQSDFAARIADETTNLSRIVSDFLNFARPQGNAREPINVFDLVRDCAQETHVLLATAQSGEDFSVLGDPTALRQAISNLLRNSAEAAPGRASIVAKFVATPAHVQVSLTDNGGGIPKENLSKVFIPFFTTKAQGTGLGLALVHRIVSEHGGSVEVESPISLPQGGTGAAFTLTFPRSTWAKDPVKMTPQSE
jgi:signal transduction histidine kinase